MPKALELSVDTMTAPPIPKASQAMRSAPEPRKGREVKTAPQEPREPLQVRWPGEDVKAAKLAALQMDFPTVSEFMLACFHAYMKSAK